MFSYDNLDNARNAYVKLKNKCLSLKEDGDLDENAFDKYNNDFKHCLEDDLNTSSALAVLYDVLKSDINNTTKISLISSFDKVLSLDLFKEEKRKSSIDENFILEKIEERNLAKKEKNYELADKIRNDLLEKGIKLIDTKDGVAYEVL